MIFYATMVITAFKRLELLLQHTVNNAYQQIMNIKTISILTKIYRIFIISHILEQFKYHIDLNHICVR